ncbi:hypothetical protein [Amycolatopsis sp. YIM 10]|uniref:hypothetical protein n=1 Tax=Amycolatopsis sp. YIM 10 TaxID=2653857 RepID=UPI00129035B9|nr:hypothetical protein [Amycolatopsis sp. YIM 10]QFU92075.1 hypothetical protein YIM_34570 [Amycolatopsis sp. YIM 10]
MDDLSKWGLYCFCLGARSTPHHVVEMDDNGRVLFHAREGTTRAELREHGIEPLESQLALLRAYGLLTVEGDRLTTAFPVLGPAEMESLRARVKPLAEKIVPEILADVSAIVDSLASAYGVLFGYVIDGLLWDRFRAVAALPGTELTLDRPYWNGAFWASYPPRAGATGTNEVAGAGAALTMVWTDPTVRALNRLADAPALRSALDRGELPLGPVTTSAGEEWRLTGDDGEPAIPVIRREDPVHEHGSRVADAIASALLRELPAFGPQWGEATLLIVAHELIWDLMAMLEAAGVVDRPVTFDDPAATPDALRAHLFVTVLPGAG